MEEKIKTFNSTDVKRRYNEKTYTIISACIQKQKAAAFKKRCAEKGIAQAQVIKKAIDQFLAE